MMRDHFYNLCRFRHERSAVIEFRKRVSWYAKQMNPCQLLRDGVRVINSPADFDAAIERFLEWRLEYDRQTARDCRESELELVV